MLISLGIVSTNVDPTGMGMGTFIVKSYVVSLLIKVLAGLTTKSCPSMFAAMVA